MADACNPDEAAEGRVEADAGRVVIPIAAEQVNVEVQRFQSGVVAVHVLPRMRKERVEVPLKEEHVEVERVPVNRFVEKAEPPRLEGNLTIVPIYEEVLVVERKLMLKEEVRIRRSIEVRRERHEIELRSEEAQVLRSDAPAEAHNEGMGVAGPQRPAVHQATEDDSQFQTE